MPETSRRKPRTVSRRISFLFVSYNSDELAPDGSHVQTSRIARRGELVTLGLAEAARLDALGALAPPGASAEDIAADIEATQLAYRSARQGIPEGA